MPSVPYSGVPSVSPSGRPAPYQSIRTSADTFGGQVGRSMQGLGQELERTGDVLAKHAIDMQTRNNEAWANDAFVRATISAGDLKAEYNSVEGLEAERFYREKYIPGLEKIYKDMSGAAPNQQARQFFEKDFRRRMGYDIENGAGYAASQGKKYAHNAAAGKLTVAIQNSVTSDDRQFIDNLREAREAVDAQADAGYWPEEQRQAAHSEARSKLWTSKIQGLADTDPFRAAKVLEQNKKELVADDYFRAQNYVNQKVIQNGSRIDADEIFRGQPQVRANAAKSDDFWGDPKSADFESTRLTTVKTSSGKSVTVNRVIAADVQGFIKDLEDSGYKIYDIGGYNNRDKRGRPGELSQHAYGNAIDINPANNPFGVGPQPTDLPPNIREIARKWNMVWGGDWKGKVDNMHFEWAGPRSPITADSPQSRLTEALSQAGRRAETRFPNEPTLQAQYKDSLETRIVSDWSKLKQAQGADEKDRQNTVNREIINTNTRITDVSQLSVLAQQAFRDSTPYNQRLYLAQMRRNATQDIPETPGPDGNIAKTAIIRGQILSTDPEVSAKAMAINPLELRDLSTRQQMVIMNLQQNKKARDERSVKMATILRDPELSDMLREAGIYPSNTDQVANTAHQKFVGGFEAALDKAQEDQPGKPLTDKERREIARKLLWNEVTAPGKAMWPLNRFLPSGFGGDTERPGYEIQYENRPISPPPDPTKRIQNQVYSTPRGPLRWTGTGWIEP